MSSRPNKEDHAQLQYQSEHTPARKTPTVLPYLVILVAAAFLLLIMAYFMQQRQLTESVEGLNQSVNTIHSFDQLVEDYRDLQSQLAQVNAQLTQAQNAQRRLEEENQDLRTQLAQVQSELAALQSPEPSPAP